MSATRHSRRNVLSKEDLEMLSVIKKVAANLHGRRVRCTAVADLSSLSDRTLKDIGIHRSQIRSVVEERLPDVKAQAMTAKVPTPFAHDREHKTAA